jgi:hypothetical protein
LIVFTFKKNFLEEQDTFDEKNDEIKKEEVKINQFIEYENIVLNSDGIK